MRQYYKFRNIYLLHNWINKLFSKENQIPGTLSEAGQVAGSATCKERETV